LSTLLSDSGSHLPWGGGLELPRRPAQLELVPLDRAYVFTQNETQCFNEYFDNRSTSLCGLPGSCSPGSNAAALFANYSQMHWQARQSFQRGEGLPANALIWQCADGDKELKGCGGVGDMMRGIAFMLYVSMLLHRPLFVDWHKLGIDMLDMFVPHLINVSIPANLTSENLRSCHVLPYEGYMEYSILKNLTHLGPRKCTRVHTNARPDKFLNQTDFGKETALANSVKSSVDNEFFLGCAARLLFQPSPTGFNAFIRRSTRPYISVHMRFGDKAFEQQSMNEDQKSSVTQAVECAAQLGREVLGETTWAIHFASDSGPARAFAQKEYSNVFLSDYQPAHIAHTEKGSAGRQEKLGSTWGDLVLFTHARGIVTYGKSNYWELARQLALLPTTHIRRAEGCIQL